MVPADCRSRVIDVPSNPAAEESNPFFDHPILNSPYECSDAALGAGRARASRPSEHHRNAPPRRVHHADPEAEEAEAIRAFVFDEGKGLSTEGAAVRPDLDHQRGAPDRGRVAHPAEPEPMAGHAGDRAAAQHWRHHEFSGVRPFFCQVEAVETAIWLTEVAPQSRPASASSSISPTPTTTPTRS